VRRAGGAVCGALRCADRGRGMSKQASSAAGCSAKLRLAEEARVCKRRLTRCPFAKKRNEPCRLTSQAPMRAHATKHRQAASSVLRVASCSPIAWLRHPLSLTAARPHRSLLDYLASCASAPTPGEASGRDAATCACDWSHLPLRRFRVLGCVVGLDESRPVTLRTYCQLVPLAGNPHRSLLWPCCPKTCQRGGQRAAFPPEEAPRQPPPCCCCCCIWRHASE
jgi:hypothetical protein